MAEHNAERLERIKNLVGTSFGHAAISGDDVRWLIEMASALAERDRMLGEAVEVMQRVQQQLDTLCMSSPAIAVFLSAYDASKNAAPAGKGGE